MRVILINAKYVIPIIITLNTNIYLLILWLYAKNIILINAKYVISIIYQFKYGN